MSSYKDKIDKTLLPKHIAIIMDGNGRWAKKQGKDRSYGHQYGVESVRKITESAAKLGIEYLTLYTFSTENWNRPAQEVQALMSLLAYALEKETDVLKQNNVRLRIIGDLSQMPDDVTAALNRSVEVTAGCSGLTLVLALSYSSRWEIVNAVRQIVKDVQNDVLSVDTIDVEKFETYLNTKDFPDPDLLIRTGGEVRISNFLLWQSAYSELYFTDEYWPEFREDSLCKAIYEYQQRERRFGKISEQL
ncbi:MAG: isoprenyl transferase [Bacteroidaceae bacterium]|nr:isoprenyl transferase [Bacteroidaceae bacterium]